MKVYEFGDRKKPVILLLSGTMCYWKGNFGDVIDELSNDFLVVPLRIAVSTKRTRKTTIPSRTKRKK